MSFINDALKKAQIEKGRSPFRIDGILQTETAVQGPPGGHRRVLILLAVCGLLIGAAALIIGQWPAEPVRAKTVAVKHPPAAVTAWNPSPQVTRLYMDALNHQRSGEYAVAETLYQQVIALDPRHAYAMNNLGVIYMIQQRHNQALGLFQRAVTLQKDYVHPYYNLACLHARQQNTAASMDNLRAAIAIKPDIRDWAEKDGDLKALHNHPDFKRLMSRQAS